MTAIVIGSKSVNATGLIRSLGMAGAKVTFISTYSKIESKFLNYYIKLPDDKSRWLNVVVEYCNSLSEKPVIFPTDDDTSFFLDDNFDALNDCCYFSNAKGNMRTIADKTVMSELAKNSGLKIAEFTKIDITNGDEMKIDFPIIIKPFAAFAGGKGDIKICNDKDEYCRALEELIDAGYAEVMIQKFLKSNNQYEVGIMGMALPGEEVVIPGVIHKIRSWPSDRGSTSYAKFQEHDTSVDFEKIKDFVRKTNYVGLFDVELIISDNVAWFIEINYRNGQYGFLPTAAGYNLPYNLCLGLVGNKIEPVKDIKEVYYINERDDYLHVKNGTISKDEWKQQFKNATAYGMYCKNDMRPFIRQYVKIPDRVVIKMNQINKLIKDLLIKEEWCVAFRKKKDTLLYQDNGTDNVFTVLNNSVRYWAADPFIISNDGKDYLFFEMFDRFKSKGLIGYREIFDGKVGKMQVAYEANCHLSFPFIYKENDKFYMMPESSEGQTLDILETDSFPTGWRVCKNLARGRRFVDSSLFDKNGNTYLFTQELKDGYSFTQLDLYEIDGEKLIPSNNNPIVDSAFNSRLAGRVFENNGEIIRVSQDCSEDYGKQLNFNKLNDFSIDNYDEAYLKGVTFEDVKLDKLRKYFGIHTYNFNENYEVIDLKEKSKIKFGNIVNIFWRIIFKLKK